MTSSHHGHIICLYAGRAVYCPKMATLQATLKAALDCLSLDNSREVHFAFPHSDLAILVEISALAFKNVRDGAILYLCDGRIGPVYPHELALQAQEGQARRPAHATRAVTAAPDAVGGGAHNEQRRHTRGRGTENAVPPARTLASGAGERSRGNGGAGVRTSNTTGTSTTTTARAARASRRSRRQTNEVPSNAAVEEEVQQDEEEGEVPNTTAAGVAVEEGDKEMSEQNYDASRQGAGNNNENVPGPSSSRNASSASSSSIRVKRELMEDQEEAEEHGFATEDAESNNADPYFKRRRLAN